MRVTSNYAAHLNAHYQSNPGLDCQAYSDQYSALMTTRFGWSDVWTRHLGPFGYECWEPVANARAMQFQWAKEHGFRPPEDDWQRSIIEAQAIEFKPDVIFAHDYGFCDAAFCNRLREQVPSVRLVIGYCAAPFDDIRQFSGMDVIISCLPRLAEEFRNHGFQAEHIHHAFDETVLGLLRSRRSDPHSFTFVGSIIKRNSYHQSRELLLRHLVRHTPITLLVDLPKPRFRQKMGYFLESSLCRFLPDRILGESKSSLIARVRMSKLALRAFLAPVVDPSIYERCQAGAFGLDMYSALRNSNVTLNNHIDMAGNQACNMRLFEATGVGTCLLTDAKSNLADLFDPDHEVVAYSSPEEAAEKALYLLEHDRVRREIAEAGQRRTLRDHSFRDRARRFDDLVRRYV
jgi:spore maturation protein CgeB